MLAYGQRDYFKGCSTQNLHSTLHLLTHKPYKYAAIIFERSMLNDTGDFLVMIVLMCPVYMLSMDIRDDWILIGT